MNSACLNPIHAGTAGGTLLIVLLNFDVGDIGKTIVLAAIGAIVSFFVSRWLKYLIGNSKL